MQHLPAQAATAHYAAHLSELHTRLAGVRAWTDSARKAALIEEYTQQIEEYEAMIEIGAECAEASDEAAIAEEPEEAQAAELERAYALVSARKGWTVSYNAKLLTLTMWHANGARLSGNALEYYNARSAAWNLFADHTAITSRARGVLLGKLCDALVEEMRSLEALGQPTRYDVGTSLVDAFAY